MYWLVCIGLYALVCLPLCYSECLPSLQPRLLTSLSFRPACCYGCFFSSCLVCAQRKSLGRHAVRLLLSLSVYTLTWLLSICLCKPLCCPALQRGWQSTQHYPDAWQFCPRPIGSMVLLTISKVWSSGHSQPV